MMNERTNCKVVPQGTETIKPNGYAVAARRYEVVNKANGHRYPVRIWNESGKRFGVCLCMAGSKNVRCRHAVAAAIVDNGIQRQRGQA